jgi:two-component system sensor histidine kinase RpfC
MEEAAAATDRSRFRADCHALRSSAANVGARSITRLCQARAGGSPDLAKDGLAFCMRLREELDNYRHELARFLGQQLTSTLRH